jgi:broad specificity phosphatase PhoE
MVRCRNCAGLAAALRAIASGATGVTTFARLAGRACARTRVVTFLRYMTHPEVQIDLGFPAHTWHLSAVGRARAVQLLTLTWVADIRRVISSPENKAIETASILAAHLGIEAETRPGTGENDRSSTGPLPPAEFGRLADRFFAEPEEAVRGWERAVDAQRRIASALSSLLDPGPSGDIAVIGHGGVGTLWYCHLAGLPIDRRYDQPSQGHYFSVDLGTGRPTHAWQPI